MTRPRKDHSWIYEPRMCFKRLITPVVIDKSSVEKIANYDEWERSNRMCLMVNKHSILETIKGNMPDKVNAKSFLIEVA